MKLTAIALVPLAAGALALTGCSSNDDAAPALETTFCTGAPRVFDGKPAWTLKGVQGQVAFTVTDDAENAAPRIELTTPFSVDKTQVKTLAEGEGDKVTAESKVSVCYEGVNGRTGDVFDSAYMKGQPAEFSPSDVVPGFKQALVGQKVGSTVGVAITSADGYADGDPNAGINKGDTIVFGLKILKKG